MEEHLDYFCPYLKDAMRQHLNRMSGLVWNNIDGKCCWNQKRHKFRTKACMFYWTFAGCAYHIPSNANISGLTLLWIHSYHQIVVTKMFIFTYTVSFPWVVDDISGRYVYEMNNDYKPEYLWITATGPRPYVIHTKHSELKVINICPSQCIKMLLPFISSFTSMYRGKKTDTTHRRGRYLYNFCL